MQEFEDSQQRSTEDAIELKPAIGMIRHPSMAENIGVELISGLLILIGLAIFGFLFVSINSDSTIQAITQGNAEGSLLLAFLDSFGIVTPILAIVFGGLIIRVGINVRQRNVTAGGWAQVALIWISVAVAVLGIYAFISGGSPTTTGLSVEEQSFNVGRATVATLPWAIVFVILVIAVNWLNRMLPLIFEGEEGLTTRNTRMAWNLLIPTLALLILVAARPLEETFITSLTDKRFAGTEVVEFVGLQNYTDLLGFRLDTVECRRDSDTNECQTDSNGNTRWALIDRAQLDKGFRPVSTVGLGGGKGLTLSSTDSDFGGSVMNTLYYTVISVSLELVIGLFIAMVVNTKFSGQGIMRAVMLVPWAIPTVISARLWEIMLRDNQSGIINKMLVDFGLISQSQAFLANPDLQLNALIMVDVWKTAPFMALLLLAGLQTIPADLYEAADVDGASKFRQLFSITLPLLRPTIAVALVFRTLDALRAFDVFNVLLGRQKLSMAAYNFEVLVQNQDAGYASAIGVIIFVLISIFAIFYVKSLGVDTE